MAEILILRHSQWDYVQNGRNIGLNEEGVSQARSLEAELGKFDLVLASEYRRAQETAEHLSDFCLFVKPVPELNELEFPGEFPTASGYTKFVFDAHLDEARTAATAALKMLLKIRSSSRVLIVSHRTKMVALYVLIHKGKIEKGDWSMTDFEPLGGFYLWTDGKKITAQEPFHPKL
ncbi:MAG: histidine phosphatase family protein [Patescibacteria group bacterium]|nr:histidine phosphatase family protein [Patescibacteria group bacterium]